MNNITPEDHIICICEGSSEKTIVELLLDADLLLFYREQLVEEKVFTQVKYRRPKVIQNDFLGLDYDKKPYIVYIGDRIVPMKFEKPYDDKIEKIFFLITRPQLEMLMVHHFDFYDEYSKVKSKKSCPNFICEQLHMKESQLKNNLFIQKTFNSEDLVKAVVTYKRKANHKKNEGFIADALK